MGRGACMHRPGRGVGGAVVERVVDMAREKMTAATQHAPPATITLLLPGLLGVEIVVVVVVVSGGDGSCSRSGGGDGEGGWRG